MATYRSRSDKIKQSLSMYDVAVRYGYMPNRASFISCPFHTADNTPSLKIYKDIGRGFYCFACGANGSVIDFVMLLFKIDFRQAVVRINADFGLGLTDDKPDRREWERWQKAQIAAKKAKAKKDAKQRAMIDEHRQLWFKLCESPPPKTNADAEQRAQDMARLQHLRIWLDANP